jgi:hypothetical protein
MTAGEQRFLAGSHIIIVVIQRCCLLNIESLNNNRISPLLLKRSLKSFIKACRYELKTIGFCRGMVIHLSAAFVGSDLPVLFCHPSQTFQEIGVTEQQCFDHLLILLTVTWNGYWDPLVLQDRWGPQLLTEPLLLLHDFGLICHWVRKD